MSELIQVTRWARLGDFNYASPLQVKEYLRAKRYPIPKHRTDRDPGTGERKDTTNDESLSELLREGKPAFGDKVLSGVLAARHLSKAISYLSDDFVYSDGRFHPIYTMKPKQRLSCVPERAEALTDSGWKHWWELTPGVDKLAAYKAGRLVWSPLLRVHNGMGRVGRLELRLGKKAGQQCTENHRWLTTTGELKPASFLTGADEVVMAAPGLEGSSAASCTDAAIVGWALTDGTIIHTTKGTPVLQIVVRKPSSVAALDGLLHTVPHTRTDKLASKHRYVRYYVGSKVFADIWNAAEPNPVSYALALSNRAKLAMWAAMMEADGSNDAEHGERFGKQRPVTQDVYMALATALGKQVVYSERRPKGRPPKGYAKRFMDLQIRRRTSYVAEFSGVRGVEQPVWCPETEAGTWVVRENGAVSITGNSSSPNVMNFPKGKRGEVIARAAKWVLRSILSDDGYTLVSCDWNSLHPTLIAYFANDPDYARVARLGDHDYVLSHFLYAQGKIPAPISLALSDEEILAAFKILKNKFPKERMVCKTANLAYKYMQGPDNMARTIGLNMANTMAVRKAIDNSSPKVTEWKWKTLMQAHSEGRLVSPFGLPLSFFDVFRAKGGKIQTSRRESNAVFPEGLPLLGSEAFEAVSFMPLATESGMLREALVSVFEHPECELRYAPYTDLVVPDGVTPCFSPLMPEHDKIIFQVRDSELHRIVKDVIVPTMNREWPELGGLRVGVDVEVGKALGRVEEWKA